MFLNILHFINERFSLKATLPLAGILWAAPLSLTHWQISDAIVGYITVFLGLLCLRASDDIFSIQVDRLTHPERGLVSGEIDAIQLQRSVWGMLVFILIINTIWGSLPVLLGLTIYYWLFFHFKHKLPLLIRPFFSNLAFGAIAVYASYLVTNSLSYAHLIFVLFTWLSVVAHEYAHSIDENDVDTPGLLTYSQQLGARGAALLSLGVYLTASLLGFIFWFIAGRLLLFLIILILTTIHIMFLELKLIQKPTSNNAKPFYIYGFTFFLLPSLGLIILKMFR